MATTDGRSQLRKRDRTMVLPTQALILRFRIELQKVDARTFFMHCGYWFPPDLHRWFCT